MQSRKLTQDELFLIIYHNKQIKVDIDNDFLKAKMIDELQERLDELLRGFQYGDYTIPWFLLIGADTDDRIIENIENQLKALQEEKEKTEAQKLKVRYETSTTAQNAIFWYD